MQSINEQIADIKLDNYLELLYIIYKPSGQQVTNVYKINKNIELWGHTVHVYNFGNISCINDWKAIQLFEQMCTKVHFVNKILFHKEETK